MTTEIKRIAVIGDYLPRQCGIATFTSDLCEALAAEYGDSICFAMPVNDTERGYDYPPRVRFELQEHELDSYRRAADFLNINNVDLVCVQHEFGIYGGPAGSHLLAFLRDLRMPVVTTLHTVTLEPNAAQRRVMQELAQCSDRLVVMSRRGIEYLQEIYGVPATKLDLIPHGIPDIPFVDPNFQKDCFGVEGKAVLLTFGLLSANKGIEFVIEALPAIVERFPDLVYLVVGATHPHVKRKEGESYRLRLQWLAQERGVEQNVIFHNRFVSLEELVEFMGAADIYLTPYLNREQITSGTLAYSVGAGKAVISTPYWYAEELLAEGRGVLVPFRDSSAIAQRVIELLDNQAEFNAIRKRAYLCGREMIWPAVARQYMESFQRARAQRTRSPRPAFVPRSELPALNLDHLRRLTDDTGILQHAVFSVPSYAEGYTTDDNSRALDVTTLLEGLGLVDSNDATQLSAWYLAFLWLAFDPKQQRFRNFLSYDRHWLDEVGSEDSHGRALCALGMVLGRSDNRGLTGAASRLFELALPAVSTFASPRAWAFALIGLHEYSRRFSGDRAAKTTEETLAQRLVDSYAGNHAPDWEWFEDVLAYSNATLPHALLVAGADLERQDMTELALRTLDWLATVHRSKEGHFVPVGSNGFWKRGGERARFDQQPIEAQAAVSACLEAHRVTGDERWRREAQRAFDWFLGRNDLHLPLYDPVMGGCRDGLHPDRVNQNRGAESTLAFLSSLLELRLAEQVIGGMGV